MVPVIDSDLHSLTFVKLAIISPKMDKNIFSNCVFQYLTFLIFLLKQGCYGVVSSISEVESPKNSNQTRDLNITDESCESKTQVLK